MVDCKYFRLDTVFNPRRIFSFSFRSRIRSLRIRNSGWFTILQGNYILIISFNHGKNIPRRPSLILKLWRNKIENWWFKFRGENVDDHRQNSSRLEIFYVQYHLITYITICYLKATFMISLLLSDTQICIFQLYLQLLFKNLILYAFFI